MHGCGTSPWAFRQELLGGDTEASHETGVRVNLELITANVQLWQILLRKSSLCYHC